MALALSGMHNIHAFERPWRSVGDLECMAAGAKRWQPAVMLCAMRGLLL